MRGRGGEREIHLSLSVSLSLSTQMFSIILNKTGLQPVSRPVEQKMFKKINGACKNRKITLSFGSTLALIAIPWPTAVGLQIGRHGRANRGYNFSINGKKKNSNLSNQVHNSPFCPKSKTSDMEFNFSNVSHFSFLAKC